MMRGAAWFLAFLGVFAFWSDGHVGSVAHAGGLRPGVAGRGGVLSPRASEAASVTLRAGAASIDITPPVGVALAGYGGLGRRLILPDLLGLYPYAFWFKPSTGIHLPIMARALVLEGGAARVLWIAVDLIGVDSQLVRDLTSRLASEGFSYTAVIVAASHTHSGPGNFSRSRLFGFLALDRFVPEIVDHLLRGMIQAARQAELRKVPARVGGGSGEANGIAVSRLDLPLDPEVGVLKVVGADGAPLALLWNYAVHGTTLGKENRHLSGDLMGVANRLLERRLGAPALYTNGAVADVSPARHGLAAAETLGEELAREVLAVWERVPPRQDATLGAVAARVELPEPRLTPRHCFGGWVPRAVAVGLGWALPATAELAAVAVGAYAWLAVPGEIETRLGQEVKAEGRRFFRGAFVVGLANGYLGYFLARDAYSRPGYIRCASLYGESGGEVLTERAKALLRQLGESRR